MKSRLVTYDDVEYGDIFTVQGFGFAPIGTIIYRDGNVVPNGFLLCDGSTKNISTYPDLANYFQTTHGSKSYYGGNGTSTFGLPYICRMPYDSDNVYFDSEDSRNGQPVGVWIDGKPICRFTDELIVPGNSSRTYNMFELTDFQNLIRYEVQAKHNMSSDNPVNPNITKTASNLGMSYTDNNQGGNTNAPRILTFTNNSAQTDIAWITMYYTKTTDSVVPSGHSPDGNGIWCIKATTDPTN